MIDEESDRLNRFIEGLSSADRRDVSQSPTLRRERLDAIVKAAVARADNLTRDHRVSVSLDDALPSLSVDPASIIEVLYTLIDNASKYSPPATRIRVPASVVDDHFVPLVADEGPWSRANCERVFENFFQFLDGSRAIPDAWGLGSGSQLRDGSSRLKVVVFRSNRRQGAMAPPSS